jgi:hypothetical protein
MEAGALPPRWGEHARRMPSSLEDLKGPAAGRVELPLHVAWSGRRVYDVGQEDQRLVLYALLLAEAQRTDLERFVHRESLVSMWPRLRRLLGPHARREWERRYGLLLAGGYAFRAHEILHRPSQDLDFATRDDTPLPEIAEHVQLDQRLMVDFHRRLADLPSSAALAATIPQARHNRISPWSEVP